MTNLAYMVREDWAQHGTTMVSQSAVINQWLGAAPRLFAVTDAKSFKGDRSADLETANFLAPETSRHAVCNIGDLVQLARNGSETDHAVVVLHPYQQRDLDDLASAIRNGSFGKVFVMIWSPRDVARTWLDASGARNLYTGEMLAPPDRIMVEAGKSMVSEEYNGLASGNGKGAVVQLVRAFTAAGYPLEIDPWLRAYFAAGGTFRHGETVAKLIGEMKNGVQHRVKSRYVSDIVQVLRERSSS